MVSSTETVAPVPIDVVAVPSPETKNRTDETNGKKDEQGGKATDPEAGDDHDAAQDETDNENLRNKPIKLYKSTRLKGYITLALTSFINFDAAQKCDSPISTGAVPATGPQKSYALTVSSVSAAVSTLIVFMHFDRLTPLETMWWVPAFRAKSRIELGLVIGFVIWWSVATGVQTTIGGVAGDGKGQFSLYFSTWVGCIASFAVLEKWAVAAGWSSLKPFIASWPYRAPVWICIMFLSIVTSIWYINLWQNFGKLSSSAESGLYEFFSAVPASQWQWLVIVTVFSICSALGFVLVELFRDIKADGSNAAKTQLENVIEGVTFSTLVLAWIPTVVVATAPGGAASMVGNAYFFTWMLVVFIFEGLVWWIHDFRLEMHSVIRAKAKEYQRRQQEVLAQTRERLEKEEKRGKDDDDDGFEDACATASVSSGRRRHSTTNIVVNGSATRRHFDSSDEGGADTDEDSVRKDLTASSQFFEAMQND